MAPETLKRSVITMFISAFNSMPRWKSAPKRRPTRRAGNKNTGNNNSATSVICQLSTSMVAITIVTSTTLPTTLENKSVNACWAPITSLFSRLINAPVCVREKNAMGIA